MSHLRQPYLFAATIWLQVTTLLVSAKNGRRICKQPLPGGPPDGPRPIGTGKGMQSLAYRNVSMSDFGTRMAARFF